MQRGEGRVRVGLEARDFWRKTEGDAISTGGDSPCDVMFASSFITSALEQDVEQVVHLLTVLLLREKKMFKGGQQTINQRY